MTISKAIEKIQEQFKKGNISAENATALEAIFMAYAEHPIKPIEDRKK